MTKKTEKTETKKFDKVCAICGKDYKAECEDSRIGPCCRTGKRKKS